MKNSKSIIRGALNIMNDEVLVKVENVSKKFCSRCIGNLKRSLWYGVKDISSELFGTARNSQLRKDEFWAVDDVNLPCRVNSGQWNIE